MNPTLLEAAPRHEVRASLSPADQLERASAMFYAINSDLFLADSVMLQQLYLNGEGELRDPREDTVHDQAGSANVAAMYSIAMNMNEPASPSFTIIEAQPGVGREVVTVGLREGLTTWYDAQGVKRGDKHVLDEVRHQETLLWLADYLQSDLIKKRVERLNEERLHSEHRLGEFMLNPIIEVSNYQGGLQRVKVDGEKREKIIDEMQARIDKIGFPSWPPTH